MACFVSLIWLPLVSTTNDLNDDEPTVTRPCFCIFVHHSFPFAAAKRNKRLRLCYQTPWLLALCSCFAFLIAFRVLVWG